jgi:tRNA(adenine34) deaminase
VSFLDWMIRRAYERELRKKGLWPPQPRSEGEEAPAVLDASRATMTDLGMMRRALDLARRAASAGEAPIGAIVYDTATGAVLSEAHNKREKPHNDPAGHAEFIAIREAAKKVGDWRLNNATLVVTLEPCAMCAGLIVNARVGRLVFGAADPKAGAVASLYQLCTDERLNHRAEVIGGVCAEDAGEELRKFFKARRGKMARV